MAHGHRLTPESAMNKRSMDRICPEIDYNKLDNCQIVMYSEEAFLSSTFNISVHRVIKIIYFD